jgi:hypothetical protein
MQEARGSLAVVAGWPYQRWHACKGFNASIWLIYARTTTTKSLTGRHHRATDCLLRPDGGRLSRSTRLAGAGAACGGLRARSLARSPVRDPIVVYGAARARGRRGAARRGAGRVGSEQVQSAGPRPRRSTCGGGRLALAMAPPRRSRTMVCGGGSQSPEGVVVT